MQMHFTATPYISTKLKIIRGNGDILYLEGWEGKWIFEVYLWQKILFKLYDKCNV